MPTLFATYYASLFYQVRYNVCRNGGRISVHGLENKYYNTKSSYFSFPESLKPLLSPKTISKCIIYDFMYIHS